MYVYRQLVYYYFTPNGFVPVYFTLHETGSVKKNGGDVEIVRDHEHGSEWRVQPGWAYREDSFTSPRETPFPFRLWRDRPTSVTRAEGGAADSRSDAPPPSSL